MKIFLIGFMGCGKTTMGRKLAQYLGYDFIDLDKLIEAKAGMSIPEYFQKYGEDAFRIFERDTLQKHNYSDKTVISTGGGAPCYFDNINWMNENGTAVYMALSPRLLANRLENAKTERPLIKGLKGENLVNFISQKLSEREVFYKKAKHVVSATDLTAEKFAEYINLPQLWRGPGEAN